jgi:diguanylate cyclase (GGDEF)-like protein
MIPSTTSVSCGLLSIKDRTVSRITNIPDGRIISIVARPTANGGWVATHQDVTEEKRAEERIAHVAHHDALTGLPNRIFFAEQLEQALKRVRRGEQLALLYVDIDHLKRVNDTLGHPIGDQLLKVVAGRLRGCIREIDTAARLSGDEFAIIQSSLGQPSDAAALAIRIREALQAPFDLDGHQVVVDTSIGISIAPNDGTELDQLLKTADIALYEAKNSGRGRYCFYEADMNARVQEL